MFGQKKTMQSVIASFTADAEAIASIHREVAEKKRQEIEEAQEAMDAANAEVGMAEAFIENIKALVK